MKLKDYILYWYKTYRQPGQAHQISQDVFWKVL